MDSPPSVPSVEASLAGTSPCGGAPVMDVSTDGGASMVYASYFLFFRKKSKKKRREEG